MSEIALLQAVRDTIQSSLNIDQSKCECEIDELPPAGAGEFYVSVMPGGIRPGPNNNQGGGVIDEIYSVDCCVIVRIPKEPADRYRNFIINMALLNKPIAKVKAAIHFQVPVLTLANTYLQAEFPGINLGTNGFIEMLKFAGVDPRPQVVSGEFFKGINSEPRAGLKRTVRFSGMRRIQYQSNMS
jgi:hypothetical protein